MPDSNNNDRNVVSSKKQATRCRAAEHDATPVK
jgi:hypothetical protein